MSHQNAALLNESSSPQAQLNFNVNQAAASLGVSPRTVRNLISSGELRRVRIGRRVLVSRETLVEFVRDHEGETNGLDSTPKSALSKIGHGGERMRDDYEEIIRLLKQVLAELRVLREDHQKQADALEMSRAIAEAL